MPRDVINPHDKFFRTALSHRHIATDFLANYLPANVAEQLNLDSLHREPVSYVDEELGDQA
ncbi:MAG: Rpn family recombination-promoting nuclease/putative transposase, partial [Pirellulaceae bacterium]